MQIYDFFGFAQGVGKKNFREKIPEIKNRQKNVLKSRKRILTLPHL